MNMESETKETLAAHVKNTEHVRKIDDLGRIVLPLEIRHTLNWNKDTQVSITQQNGDVILHTFIGSCFLCGDQNGLKSIHEKLICQNCIDKIKSMY